MTFEVGDTFEKVLEVAEEDDKAFLLVALESREAAPKRSTILNAAGDTAFGTDGDIVADLDMADDADLTCYDAVGTNLARAGNARLRSDSRIATDNDIVGQLAEIVDLGTLMDDRRAHSGAVDAGVGANLHIVLDDHIAYLVDFGIGAIGGRGKAETVGAQDGSGMDNTVAAHDGVPIEFGTRIEYSIVANDSIIAHIDLRVYFDAIADTYIAAYDSKLADIAILAEMRAMTHGGAKATAPRRSVLLIEKMEQLCHSEIGIIDTDKCSLDRMFGLEGAVDQDGRRLTFVDKMGILGISQKSDATGHTFFYFAGFPEEDILIALDSSIDDAG